MAIYPALAPRSECGQEHIKNFISIKWGIVHNKRFLKRQMNFQLLTNSSVALLKTLSKIEEIKMIVSKKYIYLKLYITKISLSLHVISKH